MKRNLLKISNFSFTVQIRKILTISTLCFALIISSGSVADAQRHGGGHRDPAWHYSRVPAHGCICSQVATFSLPDQLWWELLPFQEWLLFTAPITMDM